MKRRPPSSATPPTRAELDRWVAKLAAVHEPAQPSIPSLPPRSAPPASHVAGVAAAGAAAERGAVARLL